MIANGIGGANTKTGLVFEGKVDLAAFLSQQSGYIVDSDGRVFYDDELVAQIFKKHKFYSFLQDRGLNWRDISKKLLPDDSIYIIINNTFFIIECKFQRVAESVDELLVCDFNKKQYQKLLSSLNMEVEYVYLLSNWFRKLEYRDVLDYIISVNCRYYFEYIPLQKYQIYKGLLCRKKNV